jgi:hypothetical protein
MPADVVVELRLLGAGRENVARLLASVVVLVHAERRHVGHGAVVRDEPGQVVRAEDPVDALAHGLRGTLAVGLGDDLPGDKGVEVVERDLDEPGRADLELAAAVCLLADVAGVKTRRDRGARGVLYRDDGLVARRDDSPRRVVDEEPAAAHFPEVGVLHPLDFGAGDERFAGDRVDADRLRHPMTSMVLLP